MARTTYFAMTPRPQKNKLQDKHCSAPNFLLAAQASRQVHTLPVRQARKAGLERAGRRRQSQAEANSMQSKPISRGFSFGWDIPCEILVIRTYGRNLTIGFFDCKS